MGESNRRKHPVKAEGRTFESILEYSNYYGLKYTSVVHHLRRGATGDEILNILGDVPSGNRYKKSHAPCPCCFAGVDYPSLSAAAEALDIPVHMVYAEKANHNITSEEAIRRVLEMKEINGDLNAAIVRRKRPCTIEGVTYPSKSAAATAYGIPLVTIRSRMAREKITFEEALCRGKKDRRNISPAYSSWGKLKLIPCTIQEDFHPSIKQVVELMQQSAYTPNCYIDKAQNAFVISIQEGLRVLGCVRTIYIIFGKGGKSKDVEYIIPTLVKVSPLNSDEMLILLQLLNELNSTMIGAKAFLSNASISVNWSVPNPTGYLNSRVIMRSIHRMIGTASAMYTQLEGYELKEDVPGSTAVVPNPA